MATRTVKSNHSAARNMNVLDFSQLSKKRPLKSQVSAKKKTAGRNNQGKITIRHRGGGKKRLLRNVNFKPADVETAEVVQVEYDPNRTSNIALIKTENSKTYVPATKDLKEGKKISVGSKAEIKAGNRLPLKNIPSGTPVCNIELNKGKGGQLARSAGAKAQLLGKEGKFAQIKLPSGEVRNVLAENYATIGQIDNLDWQNVRVGNAGRKRNMGRRPQVRGKAMNPTDHPHGGGEGGSPIGMKHPKTPWGKPALGLKTRRRKYSNAMIVRKRKRGK